MNQREKVLVTGGAGFIGSHVVDSFLSAGYDVVVVDDLSTGRRDNLHPEAKFHEIDIRSDDLAAVFEAEKPDYVSHHAAQMEVRRSVSDPLFDASVNVLGTLNLLECVRQNPVKRFVYASTGGAVYGEPIYLPCDETHPVAPLSPYGASKHVVEHYLYMYQANFGIDYTVLRYANVYGPRQNPKGEAGVVAIFTWQMLRGEQAVINGDGEQERDFVFVSDCVRANIRALETGRNGIFNVGTGVGTTINEIHDRVAEATGSEGERVHGPAKEGETRRIFLDARKAERELGWRASVDLAGGLDQTVQYFKENELA
jgi:UDP-glucose 4-epimerase